MPYGPKADEYRLRLAEEIGAIRSPLIAAQNKTKLVAWIVSNCHSNSGRERYVEELKKHISVDVYGGCGTLKCDNQNINYACCKLLII
jgi:hypothetical protein